MSVALLVAPAAATAAEEPTTPPEDPPAPAGEADPDLSNQSVTTEYDPATGTVRVTSMGNTYEAQVTPEFVAMYGEEFSWIPEVGRLLWTEGVNFEASLLRVEWNGSRFAPIPGSADVVTSVGHTQGCQPGIQTADDKDDLDRGFTFDEPLPIWDANGNPIGVSVLHMSVASDQCDT